jgi:uncharacterized protein YceK
MELLIAGLIVLMILLLVCVCGCGSALTREGVSGYPSMNCPPGYIWDRKGVECVPTTVGELKRIGLYKSNFDK